MTGKLYGDGGLDCLAEVPLWQRHLECAVSVPVYAFLAYTGCRAIRASLDQGMAEKSQSDASQHSRGDSWLAVVLAFVLGWEFVSESPSSSCMSRPQRARIHLALDPRGTGTSFKSAP